LEGQIECSILKYSDLDRTKARIDAEYYQNKYLDLEKRFSEIGKISISDLKAKLDCSAFYPSITDSYNYCKEGVPFLRVNEIQDGLVKITPNTAFIPQKIIDDNNSTIAVAYPDDIIIAKGGNTLAKLGIVTHEYPFYALSRDLIVLRTNEIENCNKYFLWVFLHSKYGQSLLWRNASQTGQPHLTLPSILEIYIPRFTDNFEKAFEDIYKNSIRKKDDSEVAYKNAGIIVT
jgi:type I restriction enzyme, S subunit